LSMFASSLSAVFCEAIISNRPRSTIAAVISSHDIRDTLI
jgi:hypothetical protein